VCNRSNRAISAVYWRAYGYALEELAPGRCYCEPFPSVRSLPQQSALEYGRFPGVRVLPTRPVWVYRDLTAATVTSERIPKADTHLIFDWNVIAPSTVRSASLATLRPASYEQTAQGTQGYLHWKSYVTTQGHLLFRFIKIARQRDYY